MDSGTIAGVAAVVAAVTAVAYPQAFPSAPIWTHRLVFFSGLAAALILAALALWPYAAEQKSPTNTSGFSATEIVSNLPPSLGGDPTLKLGNVATMRLSGSYSDTSVTMQADVTPIHLPNRRSNDGQVEGAAVYVMGKEWTFDTAENKRHIIDVGGSVFAVTLLDVDPRPVAGVARPVKYTFGVVQH